MKIESRVLKIIVTAFLFTLLSIGSSIIAVEMKPDSLMVHYPSVSPDGTRIAFCFQGDLWTAQLDGSRARRLTLHRAYDYNPRWSSDGKWIAFSSDRYDNDDIFIIPAIGGEPRRLTHFSGGDTLTQWAPNGNLLFKTRRIFRKVERSYEVYSISPSGGTPRRVMDALGDMPVMSPDKRYIAYVRGSCRVTREGYRGPAQRDIWLFDINNRNSTRLTDSPAQEIEPRWGADGILYYISADSGKYNIHALILGPEGTASESRQITRFRHFGVRNFTVSANGKVMVMERAGSIHRLTLDSPGADPGTTPERIDIRIGADYRFAPRERHTLTSGRSYAVSPNGKLTAIVARGEIFVIENKKDKSGRAVNLSRHPYRDREAAWLNNDAVIFVSDRFGQEDLFMVTPETGGEKGTIFTSIKHRLTRLTETPQAETRPLLSPDRKKIVFLRGRGQLVAADISVQGKLTNEILLLDGWDTPETISWSPDSRWLAYTLQDLNFNPEIYIHAADNSRAPVNVSMHPQVDHSPVWSPDGSKLGFISGRNNRDNDIWFAWLRNEDWQKTRQEWQEEDGGDDSIEPKGKPGLKTVKPLIIDLEGIHERLIQVTRFAGDEDSPVISADGKSFYFTAQTPGARGDDIYKCKWDGTKIKSVTTGGGFFRGIRPGPAGKYIYMLKSGKLARIVIKSGKMESFSFSAKMMVDHRAERKQIFEEAVRALTLGFYDPNFHGRDWKELVAKYKPLALSASTTTDFQDTFNLMLGQLDASHMGLRRVPKRFKLPKETTGRLGIEVQPLKVGVKTVHVVPDSPALRLVSRINTGDIILSVDGQAVKETVNFYSLLADTTNEKVLLEIKGKTGKIREVQIRPTASLRNQLYDEWVKERRQLTEKYSNGRLGYLHIRSMGLPSFERFEREITACGLGKEGIVIDVRFNGGGWTTDYLMAVLNVKQHAYTIPRGAAKSLEKEHRRFSQYYDFGTRLPFASWVKPSIALCNSQSYSNAEIFSHAFKTLGLGKLVGEPTFGAVISTGSHRLLGGASVRMPYRAWFVKGSGINMEHGPAVPDIIVGNPPEDKARGEDTQLKRAVKELLKEIDETG